MAMNAIKLIVGLSLSVLVSTTAFVPSADAQDAGADAGDAGADAGDAGADAGDAGADAGDAGADASDDAGANTNTDAGSGVSGGGNGCAISHSAMGDAGFGGALLLAAGIVANPPQTSLRHPHTRILFRTPAIPNAPGTVCAGL